MFTILRSSAGAGKTHALVKHYLTHALRTEDPSLCRRVLALTFELEIRCPDHQAIYSGSCLASKMSVTTTSSPSIR